MKLKTKKTEIWITETIGELEAQFLVAPMTPKEDFELIEKCKQKEWDRNQRFENPDFYKFKISKVVEVIKDWTGIEDENGKPLECNRFNKEIAYLYNSDLIDRVLAQADKIGAQRVEEQEELEKNLVAGQSGPAKKEG